MAAEWIAVDWGTSNLRVWAIDASGQVVGQVSSDEGMGRLKPDAFEGALLKLAAPFLGHGTTPVLCCGMIGSRQGWHEVDYLTAPCAPPTGRDASPVAGTDPRLAVHILPGVKQTSPPDIMRGEETQIAGFIRRNPDFDGVICLPGTHTKWAQISAGEIVSFRTCMTGELFSLLSEQSVLRHSVGGDELDRAAFDEAVSEGLARPNDMAAQLFRLRAASLVAGMQSIEARARLSGFLIGAELGATKPYWLGQPVAIVGAPDLAGLYGAALKAQGCLVEMADVTEMTLLGLTAAYDAQKESA